jgi:tetratricopeptide (TPR) repeat protein
LCWQTVEQQFSPALAIASAVGTNNKKNKMTESTTIYDDFYNLDLDNSTGVIKFYEKNLLLLDNKSVFQDKDDFDDYITIVCQYVISLDNIGKYTKTLKYAERGINLIDLKLEEYNIDLKDYSSYWSMLSSKGRAHFYLKDYKNSIQSYERLHSWDPERDNIKNWLESAKSRQRNSINKYLYITAIILILTEMIFGNKLGNPNLKLYMSIISFVIFLTGVINEYYGDNLVKLIRKK